MEGGTACAFAGLIAYNLLHKKPKMNIAIIVFFPPKNSK